MNKNHIFFLLSIICLIAIVAAETGWWDNSFSYRSNFTINSSLIDSDLTNWTLIITHNVSGMQNENGSLDADGSRPALNGGGDLRFTDNNGNRLGIDIRNFTTNSDPTQAQAEIAILIPNVSSSEDTIIWMYWGNTTEASQPAADEEYGQYSAYNSEQIAMISADEDPSQDFGDRLGINWTVVDSGTRPSREQSILEYGYRIEDGEGLQAVDESNFDSIESNAAIGIMVLGRPDDTGPSSPNFRILVSRGGDYSSNSNYVFVHDRINDEFEFPIDRSSVGSGRLYTKDISTSLNNWYSWGVDAKDDGSIGRLMFQGVSSSIEAGYSPSLSGSTNNPFRIGLDESGSGRAWRGSIDEMRIFNQPQGETAHEAYYNNFFNMDGFIEKSDEEEKKDPIINISLVYPTENISVYKNRFFNFTVNVSCSSANCGEINVSLDPSVNWWNSSFEKRKEINITNVGSSTLTDFPAYLNITYNESMNSDFSDLRFINGSCESDSSLELAYEIENYTSSKADIWIRIPNLVSGENSICMYYSNNTPVSSGENASGVWDDNYQAVYHMTEADAEDSTSNNRDGTSVPTVTQVSDGRIDGADNFDGDSGLIYTGDWELSSGNFTLETWMRANTLPDAENNFLGVLSKWDVNSKRSWVMDFRYDSGSGNEVIGFLVDDTGTWQADTRSYTKGTQDMNTGTWYHIVGRYTTNDKLNRIYVNGVDISDIVDNEADNPSTQNVNVTMGASWTSDSAFRWFDGRLDEVRFSNSARSIDWINQSYQIVQNQDSFVAFGSEENYSAPGKGLVSTTVGATPFYTNATSNPLTISLNKDESQLVTFWVNATGDYDSVHDFFAFANFTSNMSISDITNKLNITIISNPINITTNTEDPESPTNYVGQYKFNITVFDYDGDYDTVYFSWNNGENQTITTYANISEGREYYHTEETPITGNDIPFVWFVNDSQGNIDSYSGTYTISSLQIPASLHLDKIVSLQELNSTHITYNISLKTINKGGSFADDVTLIDSDSDQSPYDLGNIDRGNTSLESYLKSYTRNSTTYNVTLAIASVNGTDHLNGNETSDNSSEITLVVPSSTTNTTLTVFKNAYYLSENLTDVDYNLTIEVVNSGGEDLTEINVQDSDIGLDTTINLNRTQSYITSGVKAIAKSSSNSENIFAKSNATYDEITYESNELKLLIPGYGSSGALFLVKSLSLLQTTNDNVTYNISLSLTNNGGRSLSSVEISDADSESSPYSIGTLTSGQEVLRSYIKTYDKTTYASNQTLAIANANGTDDISGLVETSSEEIIISIAALQTPASFILDKIVTIHNMTNTTINYNVTLRITNKGGSDATNCNITDSDSSDSPYLIGTIQSNETVTRSYIENLARQDTTYYQLLSTAIGKGIDSYTASLISANSTEINVSVPDTTIGKQLVITKNVIYLSENSTTVTYNVSSTLYNSGDEDLTSINYVDTDLNDTAFTIDINKGDFYLISKSNTLDKAASNANHQFALGTATISGLNFYSNRPTIRIPGYGGPADAIVYAPSSISTSTSFDTTIQVENQNPDIGQDFTIDYWITNEAENTNYTSGQQTIYVASSGTSNLTATLTSPSSAGTYRYRALVTWAGGTATAYDSFEITYSETEEEEETTASGGGGGITGKTIYELEEEEIKKGKTQALKDGEKVKFTIKRKTETGEKQEGHSLELIDLQKDKATITIYSQPITLTLYIGEEEKIDINNNSIYDLYIKLEKIEKEKAFFNIKTIEEKITIEEIEEIEEPKKTEIITKIKPLLNNLIEKLKNLIINIKNQFGKIQKNHLIIGASCFVIILLLFLIIKITKRKKKKEKSSEKKQRKEKEGKIQKLGKYEKKLKKVRRLNVFGEDGTKIGKIKEIYLNKNRIYGWMIILDKKIRRKTKLKKILLKQRYVKSVKDVLIIKERVAEHLEKYKEKVEKED